MHSHSLSALEQAICSAIAAAGGWIGFDRFMTLALYTPGLGYYAKDSLKFGKLPGREGSDFVTAPEISPLFGYALAKQVAQALARTFGLAFSRVQFTSDLMPSDLSGVSVFERTSERFVFHRGPLFTQVLLADEINRASPKTQSALLEAMEERQVSVDGETRALPVPFFVRAPPVPEMIPLAVVFVLLSPAVRV